MVLIHSLTLIVTTLQFVKDAISAKCNKMNMEYLQGFLVFFLQIPVIKLRKLLSIPSLDF